MTARAYRAWLDMHRPEMSAPTAFPPLAANRAGAPPVAVRNRKSVGRESVVDCFCPRRETALDVEGRSDAALCEQLSCRFRRHSPPANNVQRERTLLSGIFNLADSTLQLIQLRSAFVRLCG